MSRKPRRITGLKKLIYMYWFQFSVSAISVFGNLICRRSGLTLMRLIFVGFACHFITPWNQLEFRFLFLWISGDVRNCLDNNSSFVFTRGPTIYTICVYLKLYKRIFFVNSYNYFLMQQGVFCVQKQVN